MKGPQSAADPPAGPTLTAQGAESRSRLLEAATVLFAERGYAATSVDAVCRRAGTVRTALYWHFGSKEGLLASALERAGIRWVHALRRSPPRPSRASSPTAAGPASRDRLAALDAWLAGLQSLVEEKPRPLRLLLGVRIERCDSSAATRQALQRVRERGEDALVEGIEAAVGAPLPDLDLVAHTILSLLEAALLRRLVEPEATDLDRLFGELRHVVRLSVESRMPAQRAR